MTWCYKLCAAGSTIYGQDSDQVCLQTAVAQHGFSSNAQVTTLARAAKCPVAGIEPLGGKKLNLAESGIPLNQVPL